MSHALTLESRDKGHARAQWMDHRNKPDTFCWGHFPLYIELVFPDLRDVTICDPTPRNESLCAFEKSEKKGKVKKKKNLIF
jgi:hypothetical protein